MLVNVAKVEESRRPFLRWFEVKRWRGRGGGGLKLDPERRTGDVGGWLQAGVIHRRLHLAVEQ